jgi:hypothetical protein
VDDLAIIFKFVYKQMMTKVPKRSMGLLIRLCFSESGKSILVDLRKECRTHCKVTVEWLIQTCGWGCEVVRTESSVTLLFSRWCTLGVRTCWDVLVLGRILGEIRRGGEFVGYPVSVQSSGCCIITEDRCPTFCLFVRNDWTSRIVCRGARATASKPNSSPGANNA